MSGFSLRQGSAFAGEVDTLFLALFGLSAAVLLLVFGLMIRFAIKYHQSSGLDRTQPLQKTWRFESAWTVATLVGFLGLFVWGADLYVREQRTAPGAVTVNIVAKQWMWKAEHPEGQREINAVHLPVDRPVSLRMTSEDVIHDFGLPSLRIKHDVLPGRIETLNFTPTETGTFRLYCDQFCGTDHASMVGQVIVMTEPDFEHWLEQNGGADTLAARGGRLFAQYGCGGCHRAGGQAANGTVRAPSLDGLYGSPVALADGGSAIADDQFLHDAITRPQARPAAGYAANMPTFAGVIPEADLFALVEYLKSLGDVSG